MKIKIHMVGSGFWYHDPELICSSSGFNKNEHMEWVIDGNAEIYLHIDDGLFHPVNPNKKNYGWICESSAIVPNFINNILDNIEYFKSKFVYIFTHDRRILNIDPNFFKFVPAPAKPYIQNKKIYDKTKLVSFISSNKTMCDGHYFRQKMIDKFKNTIVDHYGRGFGDKELPGAIEFNGIKETGKILGLKDYMFSIAMENDSYDDIFCEKITDCFSTGTIPIFWGTKNIGNYFDINGIIFLEDLSDLNMLTEELYLSKMNSIKTNFEIACNLITSEDYIALKYLK